MRIYKKFGFVIIVLLCVFNVKGLGAVEVNPGSQTNQSYRLGPGDVLEISVWKNPDLSRVVTILPNGSISFPLIGEVAAADKTLSRFQAEMRDMLERFVPQVDLNIIVSRVNSQVIYVIGRVNKPGRYPMHTPLNVIQALATAGGLSPFAKADKIKIFPARKPDGVYHSFNYKRVSKGKDMAQNIQLQRGDVIVVP